MRPLEPYDPDSEGYPPEDFVKGVNTDNARFELATALFKLRKLTGKVPLKIGNPEALLPKPQMYYVLIEDVYGDSHAHFVEAMTPQQAARIGWTAAGESELACPIKVFPVPVATGEIRRVKWHAEIVATEVDEDEVGVYEPDEETE